MTLPSKTKQIKQLKEANSKLRSILNVIKNQNECSRINRHITYITCCELNNITEEDKKFESRLADKLCPHCLCRMILELERM